MREQHWRSVKLLSTRSKWCLEQVVLVFPLKNHSLLDNGELCVHLLPCTHRHLRWAALCSSGALWPSRRPAGGANCSGARERSLSWTCSWRDEWWVVEMQ